MEVKRRTQEERSAATRGALVDAARRLWGERGYANVGTPEIAKAAGVTRGALYHQFEDKAALFHAVVETVEQDMTQRLAQAVVGAGASDPAAALRSATEHWLDLSQEPEVRQIVLIDGPVVLGWASFRDVALEHGLGLTENLLQAAMDAGQIDPLPTRTLAHVLIGALDEAALVIATAEDPKQARAEVAAVLQALLDGLLNT
ncbi:MAG: TetR/AcrR family transcriptional regulator [Actinomycetota bacterium]|nr:TetR/AcrR family transcriptional regulator [Actinomycetota bacterium]